MAQDWRYNMNPQNAWGNYGINNLNQAPVYNEAPVYQDTIMNTELQDLRDYENSLADINTNPLYDDQGTGQREISFSAEGNPDSKLPFRDFFTGDRRLHPNNPLLKLKSPITGIMGAIKDQFKYRGATEEAWDPNTGEFISAEEQDRQNALGGYYSDAARNARRQRARVVNMLARKKAGQEYGEKNLDELISMGYGPDETITTTTVGDNINQGGGGRHDYGRDRGGGYTLGGGFADQESGARGTTTSRGDARGHHSRAEGGRIGYQDGELVEDEYMAEATPAGMMEENIEEVQGEPTREQLEVIALEIFRLPLEQLNEEQLNVVYQTAMEQEPSEEEVQFAAQEGPGEGIASLV
jgi:hypothetical protein